MANEELARIGRETIKISKQGYYILNRKKVDLICDYYGSFDDVIVYDKMKLEAIQEDSDDFFEKSFYAPKSCSFYLVDGDSFEVAQGLEKPLVMNFANAFRPGGGFLNGAVAQEESLCRTSTLYASISSNEAREMYDYNNMHKSPIDSDYMLLSPNVCVFRDRNCRLIEEPYNVAVFTIPAPDKKRRASKVKQEELDRLMKERLRKFFMAAARNGYSTLVLGAWGCGAFGHDAKRVAGYFYDLFFDEGFSEFFENVVFAILNDKEKIKAFSKVFGDKIEDCTTVENSATKPLYLEANKTIPECNHSEGIDEDNIGFTWGVLNDGTPFEAELWQDEKNLNLSVIIPEIEEFIKYEEDIKSNSVLLSAGSVIGFHNEIIGYNNSVLTIGMVDRDYINEIEITEKYLSYLEKLGIIAFTSDMRNGTIHLLTDMKGNDLACVIITLEFDGNIEAKTNLNFKDFPGRVKKSRLRVIK